MIDYELILAKGKKGDKYLSRSMIEIFHRNDSRIENKGHKWFWKRLLQANEQFCIHKDYVEYKEWVVRKK